MISTRGGRILLQWTCPPDLVCLRLGRQPSSLGVYVSLISLTHRESFGTSRNVDQIRSMTNSERGILVYESINRLCRVQYDAISFAILRGLSGIELIHAFPEP